jgi:hypothetical protein
MVNARKLLEHYEASLAEESIFAGEPVDLGHGLKIEEAAGMGYGPEVGFLESPKEALMPDGPLTIEQSTSPKETLQLESEVLPKNISLVENCLPKTEKEAKSKPVNEDVLALETPSGPDSAASITIPPIHYLPSKDIFSPNRQNQVHALEPRKPVNCIS